MDYSKSELSELSFLTEVMFKVKDIAEYNRIIKSINKSKIEIIGTGLEPRVMSLISSNRKEITSLMRYTKGTHRAIALSFKDFIFTDDVLNETAVWCAENLISVEKRISKCWLADHDYWIKSNNIKYKRLK